MERIDARRALELLIDIVDQYGEDTVYEKVPLNVGGTIIYSQGVGCRYQVNGQPSCLVGHVLARAGVSTEALEDMDASGLSIINSYAAVGDTDARAVLQAAQSAQDTGATWGEALKNAKAMYERITAKNEG